MGRGRIVFINLAETPHRIFLNGITFHFSTASHMEKFQERYKSNRNCVSENLQKRYGFSVSLNTLADLSLYNAIETKGFYVEVEGVVVEWERKISFTGGKLTVSE